MCFNKEMTLGFSLFACVLGTWVIRGKGIWDCAQWRRVRISACLFWFAFMEFLQFVQYLVIDDCSSMTNKIWTALGWIHICFQPLFSNIAFSALDKKNLERNTPRNETWTYIIRFSFLAGLAMSLRILIPAIYDKQTWFPLCDPEIEGVCGPRTCSTTGFYHVQWEFFMLKPLYPFPNIAMHFLNMFVAPILMGQAAGSILLFLTGPFIAVFFPARDGERAAIWCFFSIAESFITIMTQYLAVRNAQKKTLKKMK
ncbi:hypothetical protein TRFO_04135 [Tritrichomonas foetus]|uniref:Transmembrane protein n=1 Tax=Tritrichomonas foetus TaxID=1144522 RepID=A0A1J4KI80_9EUKA|nr:hypothetical protein TRFO_04135 [Tritrichomonas foetus]|eukprot:OHT10640.1 hypothetical protein TRFO_04135 [Tritrichomonas foetus]